MANIAADANHKNVGSVERGLCVVVGAAFAAYGLTRRSVAGTAAALFGTAVVWRGLSGHCHLYEALGISTWTDADDGRDVSVPYGRGIRVEKIVTIHASPEDLYRCWRNFENLPRFMSHLKSVTVFDDKHSHWVAKGPAGTEAEWDAEIINEIPNELIGWRSVDGGNLRNAGSVHFKQATGNRGTEVRVVLRYDPPAGRVGAAVAKIFGRDPAREVQQDLRALEQLVECCAAPSHEASAPIVDSRYPTAR
jgi:uncharacterized membrane protein